jgi:hypothetical protein
VLIELVLLAMFAVFVAMAVVLAVIFALLDAI